MTRFLLAKGADMYACDDSEWHMLHWIAHENNLTLFDEIKNYLVSLVFSTRWNGVTSLYMASSAEMVTRLITLGVPVEAVTDYGDTVLLEAIFQGDTQVALCLIDKGANVLHVDHTGKTALDIANERGNFVIKQAIEKRINYFDTYWIEQSNKKNGGMRQLALETLNRVSRSDLNPIQGMNVFLNGFYRHFISIEKNYYNKESLPTSPKSTRALIYTAQYKGTFFNTCGVEKPTASIQSLALQEDYIQAQLPLSKEQRITLRENPGFFSADGYGL